MFAFPFGRAPDPFRNNIGAPFSFFLAISKNFINASMQLGDLNIQASRRLMEESADAIVKGVQIRTLADVQSFIADQTQVTAERMRGYALNVQQIAAQNWGGPGRNVAVTAAQPNHAVDHSAHGKAAAHAGHETDPQPSALVSKLIASAANDTDTLH